MRSKLDNQQPTFDGTKVHIIDELKPAIDALNEGKVEAFDSLFTQINQLEAGSQWSQRLEYYQQQAP